MGENAPVVLALATGLALGLWAATAAVVAYVMYRYVYIPWKVVRKDLAALVIRLEVLELPKKPPTAITALSPAEEARREQAARARRIFPPEAA